MDVILSLIVVYACCLIFCFYLKLEWIHPAIVHGLLWLLSSVLAYFFAEGKYLPNNYFILFANLSFYISAVIGGKTKKKGRIVRTSSFKLSAFSCTLPFIFITLFYMTILSRFSIGSILDTASFREYLVSGNGENYGTLGRLAVLSLFSSGFLWLKNSKKYFFISIVLCMPMVLLLGAKTLILLYLSTILVLTPKKLRFSKIIIFSGVFIFCFLLIMSLRYPSASLELIVYYLYNYTSGGLLAFSQLSDQHSTEFGFYTFRNIYLWLSAFYPYHIADMIQDWVFVPFPVNVYTYLRPYYLDFGYLSVVFPAIFGYFSGRIHAQKYKNIRLYYALYPITLYAILMQLLDDQYLTWLSNWILLIVVGLIMTMENKNAENSNINSHI